MAFSFIEDIIPDHKFLFPEYEIVREHEELDSVAVNDTEQEDLEKNEDPTTGKSSEKYEYSTLFLNFYFKLKYILKNV